MIWWGQCLLCPLTEMTTHPPPTSEPLPAEYSPPQPQCLFFKRLFEWTHLSPWDWSLTLTAQPANDRQGAQRSQLSMDHPRFFSQFSLLLPGLALSQASVSSFAKLGACITGIQCPSNNCPGPKRPSGPAKCYITQSPIHDGLVFLAQAPM